MSDDAEPQLPVWHYILIALVAIAILVTNVVARRSILLNNTPDVAHLADLPPKAAELTRRRMYLPAYLPSARLWPAIAARVLQSDSGTVPKFGYSVRQITLLGLPFWAYREAGEVIYLRTPEQFLIYPPPPGGIAALARETGEPIPVGTFPFWLYGWGWLAVAAVAAFGLLEWRNQLKRRELLGLI